MIQNKNRDKSRKRAAILDGAIDVFISEGYELASMDRIAETAGVSKRTIYNHFGSKENLFQAILADFLTQSRNMKTIKYDSSKSLEEQLLAFANAEIFLIDSPRRVGISRFLASVFMKDIKYAADTKAKYPPKYDMLIDWLKEAEADGKIRSDNLILTASMFYALVEGGITWPAFFSTSIINKIEVKPVIDEIIATFLSRYGCEKFDQ
jgi:TetR/AcrR family transcriptional regulator of autoinduction and epiphytic fitness